MEKIKNFFKDKKIGYYLIIADALLALIFGIIFMCTYQGAMANNAKPHTPEVMGICALLCFAIDVVALALPEHKWIHFFAILAMCFSFMKQIYLFPNLIADQINHVEFQGGNFTLNVFYTVMQVAILVIAVVASFMKTTENEQKVVFNKKNIIRYSVGALIIIASTAASCGTIASYSAKNNAYENNGSSSGINVKETFKDAVTDYPFDPASVKWTKAKNPWAAKTTQEIEKAVGTNRDTRVDDDERFPVYKFEGFYAEGYQGNYSKTYGYITLWDDGLYNGVQDNKNIFGYWYNVEDDGTDCLAMIDNRGTEANMMCVKSNSKYYDWTADIRLDFSWGTRSLKINGYLYTPVIGMYIDTGDDDLTYEYGETIDTSKWTGMQVRNDLRVGAIFDPDNNITWTIPDTKEYLGKQTVIANWGKYAYEIRVNIGQDLGVYSLDASNAAVKKNYRFLDGLDVSGVVVKRTLEDREEILDISTLKSELDLTNKKVNIKMPNRTILSYDIQTDTTEASNTITGKLGAKDFKYVIKSSDTMTVSSDGKEATVKIELVGTGKIKAIKVLSKISGDDDLFGLLPEKLNPTLKDGSFIIPEKRFFKSSTKANPYSQSTNTFFVFGSGETVLVLWKFSYQGDQTQEMVCNYTLSGDLADGVTITLTSCVKESNNQWTWSSNKRFALTECGSDELPFAPTLG